MVRCVGAFRFVVYFDEDVESASYADHVKRCPGCSMGLGGGKYLRSVSRSTYEEREVITETVGELLRDVGRIDPPFPRTYSR
jgi:hypothetical protein